MAKGRTIDAEEDAEHAWVDLCCRIAEQSIFSRAPNWFFREASAKQARKVPRFFLGESTPACPLYSTLSQVGWRRTANNWRK
jgi:hypothetical protein